MSSHSLAGNLLRSAARDMYGRFIGHIVGISHDTMGEVTAIQVEHGGSLSEYPISQVSINQNFVVLIPRWKVESNLIQKEWSLIQKKFFALDNLLRSGKVSHMVYENLRKREFEPVIGEIRKKREALLNELRRRYDELKLQIEKFEGSLANTELERIVGGMDDQTYKKAVASIRSLLESTISEKKDIESALEQLDKLDRTYHQIAPSPSRAMDS